MADQVQRARSGHAGPMCMFFFLCLAATGMTASKKPIQKAVVASGTDEDAFQHKTVYEGAVTFLGQQRKKIAMCNPSSFAAFVEIATRTTNGYCFCCVKIPRTDSGEPVYPTRFPRQFPGPTDIPALAVFTSDTGRLQPSNPHKSVFSHKVSSDQSSEIFSKISEAATQFLKPLQSDSTTFKWQPSTVVHMNWKGVSQSEAAPERNSYDLYIAISGEETIAVYNFSEISWVPPKEELQVGFNAGNDFDFLPLSLPDDLKQVTTFSEVAGGLGQLMVRISSDPPLRLGCIKDVAGTYQLTVLPVPSATFLGGEILTVSGPCLDPSATYLCEFDLAGTKVTAPASLFGNNFFLKCAVPRFDRTGVATLTLLPAGAAAKFQASIDILRPSDRPAGVVLPDPSAWTQRSFPQGGLAIQWAKDNFEGAEVTLSLLGYSEAEEVATEERFKVLKELQVPNSGDFLLRPENFRCVDATACAHHHMGYMSLAGDGGHKVNRTLWSSVLPLAWFANSALSAAKGESWPDAMCEKFEPKPPPYRWTDVACPCSLQEAEINVNQFVETNDCPTIAGGCSKAVPSQRCFKTIAPKGTNEFFLASVCCFSTEDSLLLYSEDIGFDAKGNHGSRGAVLKPSSDLPELSFFFRESLNFFYCCVWRQQARFCPYFNLRRPTPSCASFANGGFAATIGDPHVISFGNQRYTLNPVGDFVLLRSDDLEVQVRFAKGKSFDVTFLTAVAFRAGDAKVCVLLRSSGGFHVAFRNGTRIGLEGGAFSKQGVHITETGSATGLQVLIASGNNSLGLLLKREEGANYINMETSISRTLQGKTVGFLGRWQGSSNASSMVKPDGTPYKPWNPTDAATLKELAEEYKVKNEEDSLFWYRPPWTFNSVNPSAQKETELPEVLPEEMPAFCENDKFCAFDNKYYNDEQLAKTTLEAVKSFDGKLMKVKEASRSCGRPNLPAAVFNSRNFRADSQIEVTSCRFGDAYQLKKTLRMTCRAGPDGSLRWEPDPSETECIYVGEGSTQPSRAGLIAGLLILFLLLIFAAVVAAFCFVRRRRRAERKPPQKAFDRSQILSQGPNPVPVPEVMKPYDYHADGSGSGYPEQVSERSGQRVSQSSPQSSDVDDASPAQRRLLAPNMSPDQERVQQQLRQTLQMREDDSERDDDQELDGAPPQPEQYNQHQQQPPHPSESLPRQPQQQYLQVPTQQPHHTNQQQPRQQHPQNPRQQPPYNPQNPRQQPPYNPQNPRQQPPYNPQNPQQQQQPYHPQNPRQQPPYNPQNPRQQPPYNPQNPRQQPPYNPQNPQQQQQQYHPQNPRQQPPYNPQNPRQQPPYNPQQQQQQQAPRANLYQKRSGSGDYQYSPGRQSGGFVSSEATV